MRAISAGQNYRGKVLPETDGGLADRCNEDSGDFRVPTRLLPAHGTGAAVQAWRENFESLFREDLRVRGRA